MDAIDKLQWIEFEFLILLGPSIVSVSDGQLARSNIEWFHIK